MNKDVIEGKWDQLVGKAKAKWGDLTDDDLTQAKGNAQVLAGKIQERYGKTKEEAEKEIDDWLKDTD
ncbi:CsbD family protein [Vitreoscilla massiliensis]|uniref:CsbD family protein n=1 Tax=Vitreoscilla massiliensis TaxID=1689272 RepID=A0ABY4E5H4_9NEIS|nr:CsbD family protein [Vitreoscilla massiliensis]UOO91016.1 CsbD family protein [Vitreoscilla massiliensis]